MYTQTNGTETFHSGIHKQTESTDALTGYNSRKLQNRAKWLDEFLVIDNFFSKWEYLVHSKISQGIYA